jgi:hypothetical protein
MTGPFVRRLATAFALALVCCGLPAIAAGPTPAPSPSASPAVAPTPSFAVFGGITYLDQAASGPGTAFLPNVPYEPQTPYEFFTQTPGAAASGVQAQLYVQTQYQSARLRGGFLAGTESISGNSTNVLFFAEPMLPTVSPFVSSRNMLFRTPLRVFDQVTLSRSSLINAWMGARDGSWNVKGGWFLPSQTLSFVFAPPPLPNTLPSIAPRLPESYAPPNVPAVSQWTTEWPELPLQGVDASARAGRLSLDFFDGALPTRYYSNIFSDTARIASLSASIAGAHGSQFALQIARVAQDMIGNTPIPAGVLYGGDLETQIGPEGYEPESDVYGQRTTLVGLQAILHPDDSTAVTAELARSWFAAQFFSARGQPTPGGYYHVGAVRSWRGQHLSADLYRFEPAYAPNVLPYGNFVNLWPVAWAWPSNWLKFEYQLVANDDVSVNRQGFRVRYDAERSHFNYGLGYASFAQVTPFNNTTALQPGFTDPFFTSGQDAALSYRGIQRQTAGWLQWHAPGVTASLDLVDDVVHRAAPGAYPDQAIDLDIPQAMLTLSHASNNVVYAVGEGRFAINGSYASSTPSVDIHQRVFFGGVSLRLSPTNAWLVEWRRYITDGVPITGVPLSPAYTGTRAVVEDRFNL